MRFKSENTWFGTFKTLAKSKRVRRRSAGALFALWVVPSIGQAAVTLKGVSPYEVNDSNVAYFSADPSFTGIMDENEGYQNFDITLGQATDSDADGDGLGDQMLRFEVTSSEAFSGAESATPLIITVFATAQNGGDLIPIPIAAVGGSACTSSRCQDDVELDGVTYYRSAISTSSTTGVSAVEVGLYPKDICALVYAQAPGTPAVGCSDGVIETPTSTSPTTLTLTFAVGVATDTDSSLDPDAVEEKSDELTLSLHAAAPAFSCPSMSGVYVPGDGQISISTAFEDAGSTGNAPLDQLLIVGADGAVPAISDSTFATVNPITGRFDIDSGRQALGGFTNTTDGTDHLYSLRFSIRDITGRVAAFATDASCILDNVQTSEIEGFLSKSQCFIATATFQSDRHPAVLLLRRFRDEVLTHSWLGRVLVRLYYENSQGAARWLIQHDEWRPWVMILLSPFIGFAGLVLHPQWALILLALLGALAIGRVRFQQGSSRSAVSTLKLGFGLLFALILSSCASPKVAPQGESSLGVANDSNAPYLSRIRKDLDAEPVTEKPGEWLEGQRRTLQATSDGSDGSYIEKVRKALDRESTTSSPSESYIDQEKKRIQAEADEEAKGSNRSLISEVKAGIAPVRPEKDGKIHHAMGFKIGASIQREVSAASGISTGIGFTSLYATQVAPDFTLHYEFQPFHSEWLGSLGLGGQVGLALYKGLGNYTVSLPGFGATSDTQFRFLFLPVMASATYRFNLLRVVRPFVQASGGLTYFRESRDDSSEVLQGYSRTVILTGGVAFNLDFVMSRSGWDIYEELGVQHSYLTIDYSQQRHLSGDLTVQASGIQAGLTYEF